MGDLESRPLVELDEGEGGRRRLLARACERADQGARQGRLAGPERSGQADRLAGPQIARDGRAEPRGGRLVAKDHAKVRSGRPGSSVSTKAFSWAIASPGSPSR